MAGKSGLDEPQEPPNQITQAECSAFKTAVSKSDQLSSYDLELLPSSTITSKQLEQCLDLVALTSAQAYMASPEGWSARKKRKEMQLEGMRYILLRTSDDSITGDLIGFLSYLPTLTPDPDSTPPTIPVLYVYEIHLNPTHQGKRLGEALMSVAEEIAGAMDQLQKTMLTVFTSNSRGMKFYNRLSYEIWDEALPTRRPLKLRGKVVPFKPSYVILAKNVTR